MESGVLSVIVDGIMGHLLLSASSLAMALLMKRRVRTFLDLVRIQFQFIVMGMRTVWMNVGSVPTHTVATIRQLLCVQIQVSISFHSPFIH